VAARVRRVDPRTKGAFRHVDRVEVHLWGHFVGVAALDPAYGYYAFRYTPEFRATGIELAPLQMPLSADRTFLFTDLPEATYRRLPAMLADALPDDFGNALINRYMAERGIPANEVTPLDRLAYMARRGMGAITFRPPRGPRSEQATPVQLARLVGAARLALRGELGGDDEASAALRSIIEVGTSAGGARAKAVIAWNPDTEEIRSGHHAAPQGFQHWLLKFDGVGADRELGETQHYGRIEYAYSLMARAAGVDMMPCRLLEENGRAHFMTRRFDRDDADTRHHVQSLCAMAHLDYRRRGTNAYAQLFSTVDALELSYPDREEVFRRMVFNVMGRNCDDHSKNFGFRLNQGGAWVLAPAFDVTFAHNPRGEWTHQHLMSVNGKFRDITEQDLLAEADRFAIGTAPRVIDEVRVAIKDWSRFARQAKLPDEQITRIRGQLFTFEPRRRSR
jgi:serine/threonine-protein kinase HipA